MVSEFQFYVVGFFILGVTVGMFAAVRLVSINKDEDSDNE